MRSKLALGAAAAAFLMVLGDPSALTAGSTGGTETASVGPQYGAFGLDLSAMDASAKPGDDFFRYANGAWVDKTPIPADKAAYSLRLAMSDAVEQRLHQMMEEFAASAEHEPTTNEGKIGAYYKSFMNVPQLEQLGGEPLEPLIDEVRAVTSREGLAALMGRNNSDFLGSLFYFYIDADLKDPKKYAFYIVQGGIGMPDRDYYLKDSFAPQKAKYQTYTETMLTLIGWPEPKVRAQEIVDFETKIAEASWTRVQQRDPVASYNPMTPKELKKFAPGFAWDKFLEAARMKGVGRVIVAEKSAFPKLAVIFKDTPLETLKAWEAFKTANNAAPYLAQSFVVPFFEFYDKAITGQQVIAPRWKGGVRRVSGGDFLGGNRFDAFGTMGWAVGELYTARYFPPDAKAKIEDLVANLKAAYRARIEQLDWMGPATKAEALKKLDTYAIKVGYPEKTRDYSGLVIRDDDLFGNVRRAGALDWAFYTGRFDGPVDRSDWIMTPQTNNAYNGTLRDIVFPAAILQPPIFDPNADPALNYGAAGAIIGHELTHGFDDQGRKIDADGALRDWWTPEDAAAFVARAAELSKQYSQFEPLPGVKVNGDLTLGENIADLGGLTLALEAYRVSLKGEPAPVLGGLTGDQRVLLGWAQAWRGKLRDEAIRRQVASDPHSPRMYRVNGVVRNMDAWYDAFGVAEGEKLFIAPEARVRIW